MGNPQIRSDKAEIHPLAHLWELLLKLVITLLGGKGEAFLVAPVQATVFILMDDSSPIAQFEVRFPQPAEVGDEDAVCLHLFQCLHKLLAHLILIKLVHAEHDAPVSGYSRKPCRIL